MYTVFQNKRLLLVSLLFSTVTAATTARAEAPSLASCMQTQCDPARIFSWPTMMQSLQNCMDTEVCATAADPNAILNSMRCSEVLNNNLATCQILSTALQNQGASLPFSAPSGNTTTALNNFSSGSAPTRTPPTASIQAPPPSPSTPPAFEQTKPQSLPLSPGPVIPNTNNTKRTFNWF